MTFPPPPLIKRLDILLEGMPSSGRAVLEAVFALALLFLPGQLAYSLPSSRWLVLAILLASLGTAGVLLVVLRRAHNPGRNRAVAAVLAGVLVVLTANALAPPQVPRPRLGTELDDTGSSARVTRVVPNTAAEGHLLSGDLITAVNGQALEPAHPADDLRVRMRDSTRVPAGVTRMTVQREGETLEITVDLPEPASPGRLEIPALVLRAVGVMLALMGLLWGHGQSLRQIGLRRFGADSGFWREIALGIPILAATMVVHVVFSTVALVATRVLGPGLLQSESSQRVEAIGGLTSQVGLLPFAVSAVVLAAFEELTFRGFLLGRVRQASGRWWVAVVTMPLVFGLGHYYEGTLAIAQAAVLGLCFSAAFLWRGRLEGVVVAHAGFNTITFTAFLVLQRTGALELLRHQGQ